MVALGAVLAALVSGPAPAFVAELLLVAPHRARGEQPAALDLCRAAGRPVVDVVSAARPRGGRSEGFARWLGTRRRVAGPPLRARPGAPATACRRPEPVIGLFPGRGAPAVSVAIIDYGSGNLHSADKAFERAARDAGLDETIAVTVRPGGGSPRPTASCCRASAPSRIAGAGLDAVPGMIEALDRDGARQGPARSSASASACSSWRAAASNTRRRPGSTGSPAT